jgi:sugar phosphate isomerase/epimerase
MGLRLGVYTAILHDRPLPEALDVVRDLGLDGAEINVGGFLPPVHMPTINEIETSTGAADDYLGLFAERGLTLAGLNCNGNPLHPDPEVRHADDLRRAIRVAAALGQTRVVTMSGTPGNEPGSRLPAWSVLPWDSAYLDARDHQWEVGVRFWREIEALAADHDVKVAIELHPHNLVYNARTLERLVEQTGATHIGAELDPSHLFWQGMDPIAVIEHLGPLVFHAAAKDVRMNDLVRINGVLFDHFRRVPDEEGPLSLGGRYTLGEWPKDSSWDFVALGVGHDAAYWAAFLDALAAVDPDMAVNIEHEDASYGRIEGLEVAAGVLLTAAGRPVRAG